MKPAESAQTELHEKISLKTAAAPRSDFLPLFFGAWVLLAICLQTWGVASRNVFNMSTAWLDDMQRFNFIWLIWILAAIAYGTRGLIKLDLLQSALVGRPTLYHAVSLTIALIELIFGASLTFLGGRILSTHLASGETTAALSIPVWILTAGFVAGCTLLTIFALKNVVLQLRRLVTRAPVEHESEIDQEVSDAAGPLEESPTVADAAGGAER